MAPLIRAKKAVVNEGCHGHGKFGNHQRTELVPREEEGILSVALGYLEEGQHACATREEIDIHLADRADIWDVSSH